MPVIYHITSCNEWEAAFAKGSYAAPSLETEGFIHCCTRSQVQGVLQRYFKGATDLVLLEIATEKIQSRLVYEWSPAGADEFPHIYGPINTDAVISTGSPFNL
ncbi:DUF952 domain-containing protein [Niastella populi]|uniref:DUF952 domain-containing protein n=1 Tax=Niastella populi TaxID=550983 RepID=A0A1V9FR65_9BACT|nr:DUF952 domain-containing protein [Niastella populi]OQP60844.1 hypothetical protein A4R26_19800 [Niastella populi]